MGFRGKGRGNVTIECRWRVQLIAHPAGLPMKCIGKEGHPPRFLGSDGPIRSDRKSDSPRERAASDASFWSPPEVTGERGALLAKRVGMILWNFWEREGQYLMKAADDGRTH